jgi:chromosomal replication initiation ATPase DnaA
MFNTDSQIKYEQATIHDFNKMMEKAEMASPLITADYVINNIARHSGIDRDVMLSSTRDGDIVKFRQIAQFYIKTLMPLSNRQVGELTGGKDHATVMHSCKTVKNLVETDKEYRKEMIEIDLKYMFYYFVKR